MISVEDVIQQIRLEEEDTGEKKYSTWEIEKAITKAMRHLSKRSAIADADFSHRSVSYTNVDEKVGVVLPDDFISVKYVMGPHGFKLRVGTIPVHRGHYAISNNMLLVRGDITLVYEGDLCGNLTRASSINIPAAFFDVVVAVARLVLTNAPKDILLREIAEYTRDIVAARKYSNARIKMQFRV